MSGIVVNIRKLTPETQYSVQFCPSCQNRGFPYYLVCEVHQLIAEDESHDR